MRAQSTRPLFLLLLSIPFTAATFVSAALGDTARESAAKTLVEPAFPIWLAQAKGWTTDVQLMATMTGHAIAGLSTMLPGDCDVARMKRDVCGIRPFSVPSSSMSPSVQEGEIIAAQILEYKPVARGDLVVHKARFEGGNETLAITRIIGLPGETVEMRNGRVFINGKAMAMAATGRTINEELLSGEVYTETTPEGRSYSLLIPLEIPGGVATDVAPLTLPEDSYFVLGDNRYSSVDSRYPRYFNGDGLVRGRDVIGVSVSILASRNPERIGKPLR